MRGDSIIELFATYLKVGAILFGGLLLFPILWLFDRDDCEFGLDEPLPCFRKKDSCGFVDSYGASAAFSGTALSSFGSSPAARVSPAVAASIPDAGLALISSHSRPLIEERR